MSELKSCPFCGGEGIIWPFREHPFYLAICKDGCGCQLGDFKTREEAIKAWNTRAERTCENITEKKRANQFECSKCHCIVEDAENYYVNVYERGKFFKGNTYDWNYCPNCGAKVIDARGDNS